jgi:hypothetical protein
MKKYILIQNDGEIETNSFELIGASTKRDNSGKIGFFGSGLKYSIAYMMRNGIDFKVFSGLNEILFTTTPEKLKDQKFDRICINGSPTSYTITMGPTWTEDWFVLREIYCNALDEGGCQMVRETENVNPCEGKTRIYIEYTQKLSEIVNNWDSYFSSDRDYIENVGSVYTCYLGGKIARQNVSIYKKTDGVIYRKGIRVYSDKSLVFDYGFDDVAINEDRTAKNTSALSYCFSDLMAKFPCDRYVLTVLRSGNTDNPCYEYKSIETTKPDSSFSDKWIDFAKDYLLVIREKSGKFAEQIGRDRREVLLVPQNFARALKEDFPQVSILGMGKSLGNIGLTDIEITPKMEYLLKDVSKSLSEMGYKIPFEIGVVQFDNEDILGQADVKDKKIYLSDKLFDMGRREIAMTIMEEVEHIASGQQDETRGFQNHLISSWLKTMENYHGLFF